MFHCLWLQMAGRVKLKLKPPGAAGSVGFPKVGETCLGGQTPGGFDAANELSYVFWIRPALQIKDPRSASGYGHRVCRTDARKILLPERACQGATTLPVGN